MKLKKYAVPIEQNLGLNSPVSQHFGRARAFAIVSESKEFIKSIENVSEHFGGTGKPSELLKNQQIDVLLCGGLGPNAIKQFESFGIKVFIGAQENVSKTIDLFHSGKKTMATDENACKDHRH